MMSEKLLESVAVYQRQLIQKECSLETVRKYLHGISNFIGFIGTEGKITKESLLRYKQEIARKYKIATVNGMLVAVNGFLKFLGMENCRVKLFKRQRQIFRNREKELTREEYGRLVRAARRKNNERLALLVEALCATGIRVSEHQFLTAESLRTGWVEVINKGKSRTVLLPAQLREKLKKYCCGRKITAGPVFVTRSGKPLDRSNIWAEMKQLCEVACVDPGKVFPHNLRHLFAVTFYRLEKDIIRLADILGHSSVETTRIYTAISAEEQLQSLAKLRLLIQ